MNWLQCTVIINTSVKRKDAALHSDKIIDLSSKHQYLESKSENRRVNSSILSDLKNEIAHHQSFDPLDLTLRNFRPRSSKRN